MNRQINKVCNPTKPARAEAKATKCLTILLSGTTINRKSLGDLGIAAYNDSAHSFISILRNERFIPIESKRRSDGTSDYFMLDDEITRYNDSTRRQEQRNEMKTLVEEKRKRRIAALLTKKKNGI